MVKKTSVHYPPVDRSRKIAPYPRGERAANSSYQAAQNPANSGPSQVSHRWITRNLAEAYTTSSCPSLCCISTSGLLQSFESFKTRHYAGAGGSSFLHLCNFCCDLWTIDHEDVTGSVGSISHGAALCPHVNIRPLATGRGWLQR